MREIFQSYSLRLLNYRFALLAVFLFVLMFFFTMNEQWVGDFWAHSAAVRELITNLSNPRHPQLLHNAAHIHYSPYNVLAAFFGRLLHLDTFTVLAGAGLLNLCIFILGLKMFVYSFVPNHKKAAGFYALLLILFWWGIDPWYYSSFFHIGVLGLVLPYPSTFAMGISLIALSLNQKRIEDNQPMWLMPITLITAFVLVTHFPTFTFLAVGLAAAAFTAKGKLLSELLVAAGILGSSLLLAVLWPYYSFLNLIYSVLFSTPADSIANLQNSFRYSMYEDVLRRTWPALAALPLVVAKIRSNPRYPLIIMLLLLTVLYIFGYISGMDILGRTISYIMFLLQIFIAEFIARFESNKRWSGSADWLQPLGVTACVVLVCLLLFGRPFGRTVKESLPGRQSSYADYQFLSERTGQYDVILSDIRTSLTVPALGGKVVAHKQPLLFIPEYEYDQRLHDVSQFFASDCTIGERLKIIEKYGVDYILINKGTTTNWEELVDSFSSFSVIDFENELLILLAFNKPDS